MTMFSIVVPAYNEALRLPRTLELMRAHLDAAGEPYEVIVVDDGNTDGTAAEAERRAASWPELSVLRLRSTPARVPRSARASSAREVSSGPSATPT